MLIGLVIGAVFLITILLVIIYRQKKSFLHVIKAMRSSSLTTGGYYKNLIDNTSSIIICFDKFGIIGFINNYGLEFFGYREFEVLGKNVAELFFNSAPDDEKDTKSLVQKIIGQGEQYKGFTCTSHKKSGEKVFIAWYNTVMQNAGGEVSEIISLGTDITERKNLENRLEEMASVDALTGVINRRKFSEVAGHNITRAKLEGWPISFFLLDIDNFKQVNDTYGHDVGDMALKFITDLCKATLRKMDVVARWGGDEFSIMLLNTKSGEAFKLASRLIKTVNSSNMTLGDGSKVHFEISIGVAEISKKDNLNAVIKRADENLYKAKSAGKNQAKV